MNPMDFMDQDWRTTNMHPTDQDLVHRMDMDDGWDRIWKTTWAIR